MDLDFIKMRLELVRDASSRARWLFATTTLVAVSQIAAVYNLVLSWVRQFLLDGKPFPDNDMVEELQKALLRNWADSHFVSIPLLGIKFSVADAVILGSFMLAVLSIWLYYTMRRENHLIGQVLSEVQNCDAATRAFVYLGISGTQIFATVSNNNRAFDSLDDTCKNGPTTGSNKSFAFLIYLPALAVLIIVLAEFVTWFTPSSYRWPHDPVGLLALARPAMAVEIVLRVLWGVVFGFITLFYVNGASSYQWGTVELLRKVAEWGTYRPTSAAQSKSAATGSG